MKEKILMAFIVISSLCISSCTQERAGKVEEDAQATSASQPVRISAENTDAAEPAVAVARDGASYVVWVEHQPENKADVLLKRINPDGAQASAPVRVNPEAGNATAWRGDPPSIAVAPDGTLHVLWTARIAAKGHGNNLFLSSSRDGGKSFEPPVKVDDAEKPTRHGMHSLAVDKDGRVHLAWLDERNLSHAAPMEKHRGEASEMERNNEVFTAYSEDGGRTVSRNQMIAREACPCCKTALTTAPDGRVYVGWRQVLKGDYRHIAVATSADKGKTFSAPVIVSDDQWVIAGCPVSGPALSAGNDGMLRVLWYTEGEAGAQGLYVTQSRDGGQTFTGRTLVAKGKVRGNPAIAPGAEGRNPVALWELGGSHSLMRAELAADGNVGDASVLMNGGELPAVAVSNAKPVAAYISTINNQRSIWMTRADKL